MVAQGETEAVVTAIGGNTFFGKTVALLSEPEEVGHLRKVGIMHGHRLLAETCLARIMWSLNRSFQAQRMTLTISFWHL